MTNLIFDFDGTLFDSSEGIYQAYCDSCNFVKCLPVKKSSFTSHIGPPISTIIHKIHPQLDSKTISIFVSFFRNSYDNKYYLKSMPYGGVIEALRNVRASNTYTSISIVTNKPTLPTLNLLKDYQIINLFDFVIGIDYLAQMNQGINFSSKSHALRHLISIIEPKNIKSIYIGDTPSDGIAANESGCYFIPVKYGFYDWIQRPNQYNVFVESASDLKDVLDKFEPLL